MPKISNKAVLMPPSPIRKLAPFADKAKNLGRKVYHLNIGQPDIETPEIMLNAIRNIDFKIWAYTPSEGTLSYRTKLAAYYQKLGYSINPSQLIVTTGGSEGIFMALSICLNEGEEVIIPEPFYANYNGFSCMAGVKVRPVTSYIEKGYALPPMEELEKAIGPKTRAIMICNPNNPTGYLYTREELEALRDLVIKHDLFLLCDEAYRDFCYDGNEFISPMHLEGLSNHVIILDTVSKRYSACGARLGVLMTQNQEILDAALRFAQSRLCPPQIGQLAAEAALDTPPEYFQKVKKEYQARRDFLVKELNAMEGVICPEPGGAFYAMPSLPIEDADHFCRWILEEFQYENQTVMMAPGTGFYSSPGEGKNLVRMAYVLKIEDLTQAMKVLKFALEAYPNNTLKKKTLISEVQ
jgi:aspartate aminotransferase